jgi:hypothetical protein
MNIEKMMKDLYRLQNQWKSDSESLDAGGDKQWIKGVVHGIKITIKTVNAHVTAPPSLRGQSGKPY